MGFEDTDLIERAAHKYYTADFGEEHLEKTNFFTELDKNVALKEFLGNKQLLRSTINTSTASQVNFPHTHYKQWSLIYYINPDWKPEWAGETLFYNDTLSEIILASIYKPNRCIVFDGSIPHSIRCQSTIAPNYRYSLAMFFDK
jgi:SM-20-related protein